MALAWALVVVGAALTILGFFRVAGDKRLRHWERGELSRADVRRIAQALMAGELPDEEHLRTPTRELAASVLQNHPIVIRSIATAYAGMFLMLVAAPVLVPTVGFTGIIVLGILAPWGLRRLFLQRAGAEKILS